MKYMNLRAVLAAVVPAALLACSNAPAPPTAPAGANPSSIEAGPDGSTLKVTAPGLLSPVGNVVVEDDDPDLVISNATAKFVQDLPLSYVFEVFEEGQLVYRSEPVSAGADGTTVHEVDVPLDLDEQFTWRAHAVYQDQRGPFSADATFKTFDRWGPSCAHLGAPQPIAECRRRQFGHMDEGELVEFLRRIAHDLNRAGIPDGPWGILQKPGGNNCNGYSCDIICERNGPRQNQYDVLLDAEEAQIVLWSELDDLIVRTCEVVP